VSSASVGFFSLEFEVYQRFAVLLFGSLKTSIRVYHIRHFAPHDQVGALSAVQILQHTLSAKDFPA
jgi:hypothetical protein